MYPPMDDKQGLIMVIVLLILGVIVLGYAFYALLVAYDTVNAQLLTNTYLAQIFNDGKGNEAYPPPATISTFAEINLPIVCTPTESNPARPTATAYSGDPLPMPTATPPAARVTDTEQPKPTATDGDCPRPPCQDPKATPFETAVTRP